MLLTVSCSEDTAPPSGAILSPSHNGTVSGNFKVQVTARGDAEISKIQIYARDEGSTKEGVFVGSTVSSPGFIDWNTGFFPSGAKVDLYAKVTDVTGSSADSDPVTVTISNSDTVKMQRFMGLRVPPAPKKAAVVRQAWNNPSVYTVLPPEGASFEKQGVKTQEVVLDNNSEYYLNWVWNSYSTNAGVLIGYHLKYSKDSVAGPYAIRQKIKPQLTPSIDSVDLEKPLTAMEAAGTHYGAVAAVVGQAEIALSNYTSFQFPGEQTLKTPTNGAVLGTGQPTLTWNTPAGVDAYVFSVYKEDPLVNTSAVPVWTVAKNDGGQLLSIKDTTVTYPANQSALTPGVYYWKVIGYDFNDEKVMVAASISKVWSFTVAP